MRKLFKSALGLCIMLTGGSAIGAGLDPTWLFTDSVPTLFAYFQYCDTARTKDFGCFALEADQILDTGASYNGSKYINLDYKFSSDSFFVKNEFDPNVIEYKDRRPGFAGFKTAWDYGLTGFPLPRFMYLIFAHKGPNLNHKVTVKAWYNNGDCGAPSYNELIGTFSGSDTWKVDTLVIPEVIRNKPDLERNFYPYFEMVFIINNINPADTTSGPAGCLKIDDIRLAGRNPINTSPKPKAVPLGSPAAFSVVAASDVAAEALTYQWNKDGVPIAGATLPTLSIAAVTNADLGAYTVSVTVPSTKLTFTSLAAPLTIGISVKTPKPIHNTPESVDAEDRSGCGCGAGTGLAFIPPFLFKTMSRRKRKKVPTQA